MHRDTAAVVLSRSQQAAIAVAVLAVACQALIWGWRESVVTLTALCEAFYFVFVGFKVVLAAASYLPGQDGGGTLPSVDDPGPADVHHLPAERQGEAARTARAVRGDGGA